MTAVLDFHDSTAERSDQVQPSGPTQNSASAAVVTESSDTLPIGTEDGQYSIEFRSNAGRDCRPNHRNSQMGRNHGDAVRPDRSANGRARSIHAGSFARVPRRGASIQCSWTKQEEQCARLFSITLFLILASLITAIGGAAPACGRRETAARIATGGSLQLGRCRPRLCRGGKAVPCRRRPEERTLCKARRHQIEQRAAPSS